MSKRSARAPSRDRDGRVPRSTSVSGRPPGPVDGLRGGVGIEDVTVDVHVDPGSVSILRERRRNPLKAC